MCLAWRVASACERLRSDTTWANNAPCPPSVEIVLANNSNVLGRPSRLSSFAGAGIGSLVGDGARTAQQAIPQQMPVSVPQQHFVDCSEAETTVLPSTDTIT